MREALYKSRPLPNDLGLRSGDWVEVRSVEEILATVDDEGSLDGLPFMPEMLQYCGKRFRVFKSAHKTCDTIGNYKSRHMANAVHLEGLRCDGQAHGGCQAGCLLFWKNAWLKPADGPESIEDPAATAPDTNRGVRRGGIRYQLDALVRASHVSTIDGETTVERYRCQATEMLRATAPLQWWDPRHYMRDIISGNIRLVDFVRYVIIAAFNVIMRLHWRGRPYPYVRGLAKGRTPSAVLDLQAGELVQVRSKDEIMRTLNDYGRNRGLSFDVEMAPYCGKTFRVLRRVDSIINEKTGKMIRIPNACVILKGVTCSGCLSRNRLFCPRSIYPYWHEIWLKRVKENESERDDISQRTGAR